jgi:hypothetical protein
LVNVTELSADGSRRLPQHGDLAAADVKVKIRDVSVDDVDPYRPKKTL